jgi:protein arginine N-methyltransferase 5
MNSSNDAAASSSREINMICGVSHPENSQNAFLSLQDGKRDGFDYVVTELPVPIGINDAAGSSNNGGVVRTDVTRMDSRWWSTSIVGLVGDPSHWSTSNTSSNNNSSITSDSSTVGSQLVHSLTRTANSSRKQEAETIFWGMMEWASHMNIPAVILPTIPDDTTSTTADFISSDDEEDMFDNNNTTTNATNSKISTINNSSAKEYARLISQLSTSSICTTSRVTLWIRVPLTLHHLQAYQLLLARCDHSSSVGCMLSIVSPLDASELSSVTRALHTIIGGGHVKAISWDLSVFLKNKRGYPTLSKSHQYLFQFVMGRLGRTIRTLVEGSLPSNGLLNDDGGTQTRRYHLQYLKHLRSRGPLPLFLDSEEAVLETPYLDNLQSPLQPLGDHLEYQTYETFEKDPVKYKRYGEAVELALEDKMRDGKLPFVERVRTTVTHLEKFSDDPLALEELILESGNHRHGAKVVEIDLYAATILVVGAGRGPLAREAIAAVARASLSLLAENKAIIAKVVAIEKNPSAVLYLQSLKSTHLSWNSGREYSAPLDLHYPSNCSNGSLSQRVVGQSPLPGLSNVTVIGCDMREATSHPLLKFMIQNEECRADIVVSELLGSFGDNELSPECLDGVQRCGILKEDCVSIPQNYTAFIAPVSSSRLYSEARNQSQFPLHPAEGPASPASGMQRALETPYVVRSHAASQTHPEQACWTFCHPHPSKSDTTTTMDVEGNDSSKLNTSAEAVKEVNNDRNAHISFHCDPMHGASTGCGYGALNAEVSSMEGTKGNDGTNVTIHGFLGSFHSVLYESPADKKTEETEEGRRQSIISIAPHSFSVGMFSWFPLYFPLKQPLCVPEGSTINCSVWRRSDDGRVWYEWCAEVIDDGGKIWSTSSIHNPGGRSYHVRL